MLAEEAIGQWVRAQVFGWKESRLGEESAPLLEGVPLHVYGELATRETPFGRAFTVDGYDVVPESIRRVPQGQRFPRSGYRPTGEDVDQDYSWRGHLRRHQALYREHVLALPAGTLPGKDESARTVDSWLSKKAVEEDRTLNFLASDAIERKAEARLKQRGWGGIVNRDRLYRSLLTSQTLCFNLFAFLDDERHVLLTLMREVFHTDAAAIEAVRIEWAPTRSAGSKSGSAFDCFIAYSTPNGRHGFLGIETKYAENLADQRPTPEEKNPEYRTLSQGVGSPFRPGAADVLNVPVTSQLWYNACLAMRTKEATGANEWSVIMLSCRDDLGARKATDDVRAQLEDPDRFLRSAAYEDIVDLARADPQTEAWASHFSLRYLPDGSLEKGSLSGP